MQYIPETYFKGVQNIKQECPLAFITPGGDDTAALNRIATVHNWAGGYSWEKSKNAGFETIDNPALTGFKITEDIRRWSTSNVVWRIVDPRGFQLEISSGNMAYLMAETVINKGVIEDELQWVRNNAQNFLLPTNSEEHKKYTQNTTILNSTLKVSDISVGDYIMTGNSVKGMYLGGYHILTFTGYGENALKSVRRYFLLGEDNEVITRSGLKGISVYKKGDPKDNKDWTEYLNKNLDTYEPHYNYDRDIAVSKKKFNIKELAKTLHFTEYVYGKDTPYMIEHDNKVYFMQYYGRYSEGGVANEMVIHADKNYIDIIYDNNRNGFFGNKSDKIFNAVKDGTPVSLAVTVEGTDYSI